MAQTTITPAPLATGFRLFLGETLNALFANPQSSVTDGIVATPSGSVTTSLVLPSRFNRVTSAASTGAVRLPKAIPGAQVTVRNDDGSNALLVFPNNSTDTINGGGGGASVSVASAGKQASFTCYTTGAWSGPVAAV